MLSSINLQNSPQYSYTKCHYQRTAVCPLGPLPLDLWDTAHTSLDILFQTCWPGNTELLGWNLLTELILHQWYSMRYRIFCQIFGSVQVKLRYSESQLQHNSIWYDEKNFKILPFSFCCHKIKGSKAEKDSTSKFVIFCLKISKIDNCTNQD